jgi:hypothetical protein
MEFQPPLPAFYSYSHKNGRDRRHLDELFDALALTRRASFIDDWDDRRIRAGQEWEDIIIERARHSRVFLLVLTNRFIASDFCVATELTIARELHRKRAAAIAPILAEDAEWEIDQLRDLQVIMPFGKPVSGSPRAKAWTFVGKAVREMAEDMLNGKYFARLPADLPPIPFLLPFTIGREQQIAQAEGAIRAAPTRRPFLCVLTGARQGQSEFVKTLLLDPGPVSNIFGRAAAPRLLQIDGDVWVTGDDSVESALNGSLASQIEPAPASADREGVAAALADHPGMVILTCEVSAKQWGECSDSRLKQFFDFWTGWPLLQPGRPMIIFVTVCAQVGTFPVPGGFCVELPCITRGAVDRWLAQPGRPFLVNNFKEPLNQIFRTRDCIPMEDFAAAVLPILQRLQI